MVGELFRERRKHPHLTVTLLRRHWKNILGEHLAGKTYPTRLAGNILWINAADASWAYQLQFLKREMVESIQVFMESQAVTDLRFKVGEIPQTASIPAAAPPAPSDPAPAGTKDEAPPPAALATIADSSLRDSFSRWIAVNRRKRRAAPGGRGSGG